MTNEEAIEVLAQDLPCETDEDLVEAMTMAIKALEQQPCEDAVSRQAVHDLIAELLSDYLHDEDREKIEELDVKIEDLEPVTPKEKTGKWIYDEKSRVYRCSCCNRFPWRVKFEKHDEIFTDLTRTNAYKFCPNCGARMQEVEENG